MANDGCVHEFRYEGVRYIVSSSPGYAPFVRRTYLDSYVCVHCLEHKYYRLNFHDVAMAQEKDLAFNARPLLVRDSDLFIID